MPDCGSVKRVPTKPTETGTNKQALMGSADGPRDTMILGGPSGSEREFQIVLLSELWRGQGLFSTIVERGHCLTRPSPWGVAAVIAVTISVRIRKRTDRSPDGETGRSGGPSVFLGARFLPDTEIVPC